MAEGQAWPRYWQARRASSRVSAAIVDASTKRLFGFANAVLDAVSVQRQPLGGHRVPACAGKHLQRVACPSVRFLIECKISKRPPPQSGLRHCPAGSRPPAGALHRQRRRLGRVRREPLENVLEYPLAHLRCVGEQLSQLLDLHLGGQVLFGAARRLLFGCQVCSPPFFRLVHSSRSRFGRHRRASDDSGPPPTGLERFVLPGPYELAIFARSSA